MPGGINYLAIVVAALVHNGIGLIWYSRFVFGKVWLRLVGRTEDRLRSPVLSYAMNFSVLCP